MHPALIAKGLSKTFGGVQALTDAEFVVRQGEVMGLLGENGSGKSTIIKILAGYHDPEDGASIDVRGEPLRHPVTQTNLARLGVGFVHQDLGLIPSVSVAENFLLVGFGDGVAPTRIRWPRLISSVGRLLEDYDVSVDPASLVEDLSPVQRAMIAVVRAASSATDATPMSLLVLDEPTVFLPAREVGLLFSLVRRVAASGAGVLFVSHDIAEVCEITDRITVLRDGRVVSTVETCEADKDGIVRLILGAELVKHVPESSASEAHTDVLPQPRLQVSGLTGHTLVGLNLDVQPGEVLGVTGLQGSGFEELPYLLMGAGRAVSGQIGVAGESVQLSQLSPAGAVKRGVVLIPGDRLAQSVVADLSLQENMSLPAFAHFAPRGTINWHSVRARSKQLVRQFDIRPSNTDLPISSFSGGNQQKAVLAKWLQLDPSVIVMHEPTQGVDVGARVGIVREIRNAAAAGSAVLVASSDYETLADAVDRVIVLAQGRIVRELTGTEVTKAVISDACLRSMSTRNDIATHEQGIT